MSQDPTGAPVVLLYHRVADDANDPFDIVVSPARFREHLRCLTRLADVVPLDALDDGSGARPRVAVTFDDGYLDNLEHALPALEDAGACATTFVISGRLGGERECWWDQLEQIFRAGWDGERTVSLRIPDTGETVAVELRRDPHDLRQLHRWLLARPPEAIELMLVELRLQLGLEDPPVERRLMTPEELLRFAASDAIAIGAHTLTHPLLPSLPLRRQIEELLGSRRQLEALLAREVRTFSYPFGAYDGTTATVAERIGFDSAFAATTEEGVPWTRYSIPRRPVGNWDGEQFESRLRAWLN